MFLNMILFLISYDPEEILMFTYEQFDRNFAIFYIYLKNKSKV